MTTVGDIGELGLIDRLAKLVAGAGLEAPSEAGFRLCLGIGDDAAAWRTGRGVEVCTTDTLVEGTHFTRQTTPWADVGWKLMAANLSDIAAMGSSPLYALVTLGLPSDLPVAAVDDLYDGILDACRRYGSLVAGGDIVASPVFFASVTLNGALAAAADPMTRSAARPDDAIAVTGPLGASAGGLRLLQEGAPIGTGPARALARAHRRPVPRLEEGQRLLRAGVRCAMDVSDGLVADLSKLCLASRVSATVQADRVPVDPALQEALPEEALQLALNGGEEYQLLFTGPAALVDEALTQLPQGTAIGRITAGEPGGVTVVDSQGREVAVTRAGWDHLQGATLHPHAVSQGQVAEPTPPSPRRGAGGRRAGREKPQADGGA